MQRPSTGARRGRSRCAWQPSRTVVQRPSRDTRLRMLARARARDLLTASRRALPALERGCARGGDRDGLAGTGAPASRARPDAEGPETGAGDGLVVRETFADGGEDGAEHAIGGGPGERELRGQARSELGLVHVLFPCDGAAGHSPVDAHRSCFRVACLRERRNGGAGGRVARRRRSEWSCPRSVTRCAGPIGSRETVEERCACRPGPRWGGRTPAPGRGVGTGAVTDPRRSAPDTGATTASIADRERGAAHEPECGSWGVQVPKSAIETFSPRASALPMVENTAAPSDVSCALFMAPALRCASLAV